MLRSKRLLIAGLSLLLLIVIGLMTFFLGKSFIAETWSAYTLPQELRSAVLISVKEDETTTLSPQIYQYKKTWQSIGDTTMFVRSGGNTLAVIKSDSKYLLKENDEERVRSDLPIMAVSQAPNSKAILYAQAIELEKESRPAVPQGIVAINPLSYEIRLYLPTVGKNERVISGYAPLFINDTQFLFFAYSGLYMYDLQSGVGKTLLEKTFPVIFGPILQSPDRSLISFSDVVKKVTYVYRLKDSELSLILETPEILIRPALSNTALYEIKNKENGSEIWKYDFGVSKPQLIHTIPRSLGLNRIVF